MCGSQLKNSAVEAGSAGCFLPDPDMIEYRFRLLNVFAESTFGGNPLCVFEDARGLASETMQALAAQFNLSETTFLLPSTQADARVRVFTPAHEMRFAGHPTLGSAQVVRALHNTGDRLTLEFAAGLVPVTAQGDIWQLTAPLSVGPQSRPVDASRVRLAHLIGLDEADLLADPLWVDTGSDQLLIACRSVDAVQRAQPDPTFRDDWPLSSLQRRTCYVFAFDPTRAGTVVARYFMRHANGSVSEDPGTGSACANLGGWLIASGYTLPARYQVLQGEAVHRPCHLLLDVSADGEIRVGGRVIQIGCGSIQL